MDNVIVVASGKGGTANRRVYLPFGCAYQTGQARIAY